MSRMASGLALRRGAQHACCVAAHRARAVEALCEVRTRVAMPHSYALGANRQCCCPMTSKVIAEHLETILASLDADPAAKGLPAYAQREFYDYL